MSVLAWSVPILAYHRVGEPKDDHVPTVRPDTFERQLRFMRQFGYRVLDLGELVEVLEQRGRVRRRSVVITFDDGYEETASVAAPLLDRFGFRATVFVTPTEIGLPGFMTWDQLGALASNGITVGSHTLHHTYLPVISPEHVRDELVQSKAILEQRLGQAVPWLSYPIGGFTPPIQTLVKAAGYRAACTTNRGVSRGTHDLFAMRRIKMTEDDRHPLHLWIKLSGYYDCFRRLEQPA